MVFYRKYRPQVVSELDNELVAKQLSRFLSQESIPHAFLFSGPKGTGKTSAARILAKSINCTRKKGDACGKCDVCTSIADGDNLDILEIDAASNRGIDEIRTLKEGIKLSPLSLTYKVYIIDEVHMLTTEAFNALLKTLEEPPQHAVFVLATTEPEKLLGTIISRCIHIQFSKATPEEIIISLKRIAIGEKLDISDEVFSYIARYADGSFRDAAKILEQAVSDATNITTDAIARIIGVGSTTIQEEFIESLRVKNTAHALEIIKQLAEAEKNMQLFVKGVLTQLKDELLSVVSQKDAKKGENAWTAAELQKVMSLLVESWNEYKTALIPSLPLELAVVTYCEQTDTVKIAYQQPQKPFVQPVAPVSAADERATDPSAQPVMDHWDEILIALKPHNHSIVGVLRSCRPLSVTDGILTIESPYKFHAERLSEQRTQTLLAEVVSHVVGLDVRIKAVLRES